MVLRVAAWVECTVRMVPAEEGVGEGGGGGGEGRGGGGGGGGGGGKGGGGGEGGEEEGPNWLSRNVCTEFPLLQRVLNIVF